MSAGIDTLKYEIDTIKNVLRLVLLKNGRMNDRIIEF